MNQDQLDALRQAVRLLEDASLGARIADVLGRPVEELMGLLPARATGIIEAASKSAIEAALRAAILTMSRHDPSRRALPPKSSERLHKLAALASGAGGGAFGLPALAIELPITTTIIMRSIADIARSEGADIGSPQVRLECVEVLAMAAGPRAGGETGYFATRNALAAQVSSAARHIASHGLGNEGAPALARLIARVAQTFSISVSEKAAAQLVPVVGGIGGALVNAVFIDHFQGVARGHFVVRRLEREVGERVVMEKYLELGRGWR